MRFLEGAASRMDVSMDADSEISSAPGQQGRSTVVLVTLPAAVAIEMHLFLAVLVASEE